MRPDAAEADAPSPDHAALLRRMARDLDRFHRDPAQLRHPRPPGLADRPTVLPASIEQRLDELLHRVAALEHALGQGEATVVAEALDPLRTLLEVLTGEVTRLRRATDPDPEAAELPMADSQAAEAGAMPPFPPLPQPATSAAPTPGTGTLPQSAPPPDRPAPRPSPAPRPAGRSALIPIAVMAIPVLLLATVFMDRVPTQAPAAIHRPAPSRSPPHPSAVVAPSPRPVAPPPASVRSAAIVPDHQSLAARPPAAPPPAATPAEPATLPALAAQDRAAAPPHRLAASAPTPPVISPPIHAPAPPVSAAMEPGAVTVVGPDTSGSAAGSPQVPVITARLAGEGSVVPSPPIHPAAPPETPAVSPIPAPQAAPAAIHPAAAPPPARPSAPAASPKPSLAIRTTADAWISVIDAKGTPVFSRLMHAGDNWIPPRPGLLLTTGNAGGTELVVNGIPGPPLGAPGAVVHGVPLGVMHAPKPSHAP